MQSSKTFELFLNFYKQKTKDLIIKRNTDKQNEIIYSMLSDVLKRDLDYIINFICDKLLKESNYNDYAIFHNNVYNNINMDDYNISNDLLIKIKSMNDISLTGQNIINNCIKIFINKTIVQIEDNCFPKNIYCRYFNWLFIPIFLRWQLNFKENYRVVDNFNKLAEKFNMSYNSYVDYNYFLSNLYNISKLEDLIELIKYLEVLDKEYEKSDEIVEKINKLKINTTDESKPEITTKNDNTSKINLDDMKVQGLKQLCKDKGITTTKCKKRDDYIKLLTEHSKQTVKNNA